jgi:uracil-DNA glycosylase family 4
MPDPTSENAPTPRARFIKLIDSFESYVQAEKEKGAESVPATPALVAALAAPIPPPPRARAKAAPRAPATLDQIAAQTKVCTACPLHKTRTQAVPGQGHPHPELVFVGEGPGADEDAQGLAFVGAAGQLLTKMIEAMGFTRDEVFIANIVKCRPPGNRVPEPAEAAACLHFLEDQLALLKPKVIVTLGATALKYLMGMESVSITKMRGHWLSVGGVEVMPTFHPSYLLRTPEAKKEAWSDLKAVLAKLGRTPPPMKK